jgi:general secretion pathway protein M
MEALKEQWRAWVDRVKGLIADLQAWFARLTQRERRLVLTGGGALAGLFVFILLFSFASSAARYRKNTQKKIGQLQQIQILATSYREATEARRLIEEQLSRGNDVRLMSYVQEKAEQAGLEIPTLNPKGDTPLGEDGKIVESSIEVTLTDIQLNRLVNFLTALETGPGIVKVKKLRVEPRPQSQTLTAVATISSYKLKP